MARHARNRRLADALYQQAFAALQSSPGARRYYDSHRTAGATHHQARASWPTASSGSCTAAWNTMPATTRTSPGTTTQLAARSSTLDP
jgi:hypothetical protein